MSGESIRETNNQNLSNVDDPELTSAIERLRAEPEPQRVEDDWAAIDRCRSGWISRSALASIRSTE